jgi:hypothetical protein
VSDGVGVFVAGHGDRSDGIPVDGHHTEAGHSRDHDRSIDSDRDATSCGLVAATWAS